MGRRRNALLFAHGERRIYFSKDQEETIERTQRTEHWEQRHSKAVMKKIDKLVSQIICGRFTTHRLIMRIMYLFNKVITTITMRTKVSFALPGSSIFCIRASITLRRRQIVDDSLGTVIKKRRQVVWLTNLLSPLVFFHQLLKYFFVSPYFSFSEISLSKYVSRFFCFLW